ncbi:NAD(P)/FAD-dependent oxidoreductase [Neogemmobacter tilapiae]|uniref:Glycerol-3-phosphate dehydrogenase n=1 Tax=Neogemmobacter tilapiae TaxID=875041 RepID=A0A918WL51_9RHOB|nr:FAD-dependent oxidoreductase [Gemmobacter tilapiae]GHC56377.1 glycerol-3-phosphate dehydrogenase [Gemmobacter tilapiae]
MEADVLIIGGGVAGLSLAAALAGRASVIVLEAEGGLGHHASGRSAALYEPYYGAGPVVDLSLASGDAFRELGVLSPRGLMLVGRADQAEAFQHDLQAMKFDPISVAEARAKVPILNAQVALAGYADHAWDIDTDALMQGFARKARGAGTQIVTKARVQRIWQEGHWHIEWAGGQARGAVLVNAGGAWADGLASMAGIAPLGIVPYRRSMARIPAPGGQDVRHWPMMFGPGEDWYAKPDAGALIVSPAEEDAVIAHDTFPEDMVLAEGLVRYEAMVTEPVTRLLSSWAGLRSFAPDRVPVIGFDPKAKGLFWLAGQGGYGFQTCPAAAGLAAALISGEAPVVAAETVNALSPLRFAR